MNKNLIAIAVGAAFAIPSAAFADTKVYGKFNVGLEGQQDEIGLDKKYADRTAVFKDQNNSSRLGFKGDQDVGLADLKVIYQMEYGVDPDGTEGTPFSERNIFVGLQGGFGTVKFGKFDTPVKVAGEKADFFNDESLGDDTNLMVGETRQNNMIQYSTPKFADVLTVNVAVNPGEGRTAVDDANDVEKGLADTYYASLVYDSKMVYAAVSYAGHEVGGLKFDGPTVGYNIIRGTVYVAPIADLEFGGLYQQAKGVDQDGTVTSGTPPVPGPSPAANGSDAKENSWLVSAGYTIEAVKLKAQYGETKGDQTDYKRTDMSFGVDYKLSKSLITQAYYVRYEDKDRVVAGVTDPKSDVFGLGMVYSF